MDDQRNGYINFKEFHSYFTKVLSHWSSLINTHVKLNKQKLRAIFAEIDKGCDGIIDFNEYSSALERNPNLLDWFSLLNNEKPDEPQISTTPQVIKPSTPKE